MDRKEVFVRQAALTHNNAYNYDQVIYINCDTKVKIFCPKEGHGIFESVPYNHINKGVGCPICRKTNKALINGPLATANFIEKAIKIHGDKYDYTQAVFVNTNSNIIIGCRVVGHHEFRQRPSSHLSGSGCPLCAIKRSAESKRSSKEEFIRKACEKHGDLYDYSDVVYRDSQAYVSIKCKKDSHPPFLQKANNHLQGNGCPTCAITSISEKRRLILADFLEKARIVHQERYDYSYSEYKGCNNPIEIICRIHGEFQQRASCHLAGNGCQRCATIRTAETQRFTVDKFIETARGVHGDLYDYSKVDYINSQTKTLIICNRCKSEFQQVPNSHLQGYGCDTCARNRNVIKQTDTKAIFIEKANVAHGANRYDYTDSNYTLSRDKIDIKCMRCSKIFDQTPNNHISKGFGCPYCAGNAPLTNTEFITRAKAKHGDAFDYRETNYTRSAERVIIYCNKTGLKFEQVANNHLRGAGCPCCKPKHSKAQISWLQFCRFRTPDIEDALNGGEVRIGIERAYKADGFSKSANTVFEFQGCFYHGCPSCNPDSSAINGISGKTYGELYSQTQAKKRYIESKNYRYIEIWEHEWNGFINSIRTLQRTFRNRNSIR